MLSLRYVYNSSNRNRNPEGWDGKFAQGLSCMQGHALTAVPDFPEWAALGRHLLTNFLSKNSQSKAKKSMKLATFDLIDHPVASD